MKEGKTMELVFFVASCVLFCLCAYLYFKKENTDFKKFADAADDMRGSISSLEEAQKKSGAELKAFAEAQSSVMSDLTQRVIELETKPIVPQRVSVRLHEPVQVNLVYSEKEAVAPPKGLNKKAPVSLLKRAGISAKENN